MSTEHDRSEILFLALTRPTLVWGVPFEGLAANVFLTFCAGVFLQAPTVWRSPMMFWLLGIPIHLGMQKLTSWDYHWFRTVRLWALTTGTGRTTLESLPTQRPRSAKGVPSSA
jgi:type IV secretion system protein VirB3